AHVDGNVPGILRDPYHHTLIDRLAGLDERLSALLGIVQTVSRGHAAVGRYQGAVARLRHVSADGLVPIEHTRHEPFTASQGQENSTEADKPPGRDPILQANAALAV